MIQVWSCGGGTQSGAIASLIRLGKLPRPDFAFMTDTGRERSSTWPFVDGFIRPALASVGLELTIVKAGEFARLDVYWNDTVLLPGFTTLGGAVGKLSPFCSGKWKKDVGERWMRSVGIVTARNWIGISRDEASRIRAQHRGWLELWYPLIFAVPMTRARCVELIRSQGWIGQIPHSACWMCPNHSDAEWIDMKLNWPLDFAMACDLETDMRLQDPHFYLHPACVPLAEVDFLAQNTMFSDRGCTTGCFTGTAMTSEERWKLEADAFERGRLVGREEARKLAAEIWPVEFFTSPKPVVERHAFKGSPDRWCEVCNYPDRHWIHSNPDGTPVQPPMAIPQIKEPWYVCDFGHKIKSQRAPRIIFSEYAQNPNEPWEADLTGQPCPWCNQALRKESS